MSNRIREWYLFQCKNLNIKATVQGLKEYWRKYNFILDIKREERIYNIYPYAKIESYEDYNKYPIATPY